MMCFCKFAKSRIFVLQIEESLDILEKMDVTVLGTTGCGSPELANIHRDSSRLKFVTSIYSRRSKLDCCGC